MAMNIELPSSVFTSSEKEDWLKFKEAMTYLGVSRSTIYRLMWSGQLAGKKVGSLWRFSRAALNACMREETVKVPPSYVRIA